MEEITQKRELGETLLETLSKFSAIEGHQLLARKIMKETQYLRRLEASDKQIKKDCSNISHLKAVVDAAETIENIDRFEAPIITTSGERLTLDITAQGGMEWYKIVNKSPKLLHDQYIYGSKSNRTIEEFAKLFIKSAPSYHHLFVNPKVIFIFQQGISEPLAKFLTKLGVSVRGKILPSELFQEIESDSDEEITSICNESIEPSNSVNLDVTCMITYCSQTSHDQLNEDKIPVYKQIEKYIKGKRIIACEEAIKHFKQILKQIGGPEEQKRGEILLQQMESVESVDFFKETLNLGGRIKPLSRLIFGTGHGHRCPTITSNKAFITHCQNQGLRIAALVHEFQRLSEVQRSPTN